MAFPINPALGTTHTVEGGATFIYTEKGLWKVLSQPEMLGSKFTVSDTPPENPNFTDQWFDTTVTTLKIWVHNGIRAEWYAVDVNGGSGSTGSGGGGSIADRILPLSWEYSSEGYSFELWGSNPRFSWRDTAPVKVLRGYIGDNTLDVQNSDSLNIGNNYVLYTATETITVEIQAIINKQRVRLRNPLGINITEADEAQLARTSFDLDDGKAVVRNGDVFFTTVLNTLRDRQNGRMVIRRSANGQGSFTVRYRQIGDFSWLTAELLSSRSKEAIYRDETYSLIKGGNLEFQISFSAPDGVAETLEFLLLFPAPETIELGRVEKPINQAPADQATGVSATPTLQGSAYRSLYDISQGGAEFQIANDAQFSDIVVNSSSSFLASWINAGSFSGVVRDVDFYTATDVIVVGDGFVRYSTDKGKTYVTRTAPFSGAVNGVAITESGLTYVCGAGGAVAYSANRGSTFTLANTANFGSAFSAIAAHEQYAVVVGLSGEIQRSVNNGVIFQKAAPDNAYNRTFYDVVMTSNGRCIAVGENGEIQTATSFGAGWTKRQNAGNFSGTFQAVDMTEDGFAVAVGSNGEIQISNDYGSTWAKVAAENFNGVFYGVSIYDKFIAVVGSSGEIQTSGDRGRSFSHRVNAGAFGGNFTAVKVLNNYALLGGANVIQHTLNIEGAATTSYAVPAGTDMLKTNRVYWWRVRYQDNVGFWSEYSEATAFATMSNFNFVRQPANLAPAEDATDVTLTPVLQTSAFSFQGAQDTHVATQYQVSLVQNFSNAVYDSGDKADLLSHQLPNNAGLGDRTRYWWRARHKGSLNGYGPWSVPTAFTTRLKANQPSIVAPTANAVGQSLTPTIRTSSFSASGVGIAHVSSRYEISRNLGFTDIVLATGATNNLTEFVVPAGLLAPTTQYYVRAAHQGRDTEWSEWSEVVRFTTTAIAVRKPTVVHSNVSSVGVVLTTDGFALTGAGSTDTHAETEWEIRSAPNGAGTRVWEGVSSGTSNKLQINASGLNANNTYYGRARHRGATYGLSEWSADTVFTTVSVSVRTANLNVANTGTSSATLSVDGFGVSGVGATDTHASTDYEVWTAPNGSGMRVFARNGATVAERGTTTATGLQPNTRYYARARFVGTVYGTGPWSAEQSFVTGVPSGSQLFANSGVFNFTVPTDVYNLNLMAVGPGANSDGTNGGGGGARSYRNDVAVTPGQQISVIVGERGTPNSSSVGAFLRANAGGVRGGGAASPGENVVSHPGGDGGVGTTGYGGGGGAAGRHTGGGGAGAGFTSSQRQVARQVNVPANKFWHPVGGLAEKGYKESKNPVYRRQDPFSLPLGYRAYEYTGTSSSPVMSTEGGGNGGDIASYIYTSYFNIWEVRGSEATSRTEYDTVTDYANTSPTGTAGQGRGGAAGLPGEGVGVGSDNSIGGNYGAGGGRTSVAGTSGAVLIRWGTNAGF